MTQDLKQRVEEVFSIPFNRYHDTKLLQDRLLMASKLLKDITQEYNNVIKEFTNRQTKLEEALKFYANDSHWRHIYSSGSALPSDRFMLWDKAQSTLKELGVEYQ